MAAGISLRSDSRNAAELLETDTGWRTRESGPPDGPAVASATEFPGLPADGDLAEATKQRTRSIRPAGRRDSVHDAASGVQCSADALLRAGRYCRRLPHSRTHAAGTRKGDRLFCEHAGAANAARGQSQLSPIARPGAGNGDGRLRAPRRP